MIRLFVWVVAGWVFLQLAGWLRRPARHQPAPTVWHPYGDWDRLSRELPPRRRRRWEAKW